MSPFDESYSFYTEAEVPALEGCFEGPLTAFEESLLLPFTRAADIPNLESLRPQLIDRFLTRPHAVRAVRGIYLCAHSTELAPVLRDLVPYPTDAAWRSRICYKRTALRISAYLSETLMLKALQDLVVLGLPSMHHKMLETYMKYTEPTYYVAVACVMVLLAKALETT